MFVRGQTAFQGDADILTSNPEGVALFSRGSVRLQGFNGTQFLTDLVQGDAQGELVLTQAEESLEALQALSSTSEPADLIEGGRAHEQIDTIRRTLGQDESPHASYNNFQLDLLEKLRTRVEAAPPGPTRDFMNKRLETVRNYLWGSFFEPGHDQVMAEWAAGTSSYGIFDAAIDTGDLETTAQIQALISLLDYDRIGASFFVGLIYTNGSLYAANEVNVVGAAVSNDNGTQPPLQVAGRSLQPGDIFLDNGVRLTFNQDLFEAGMAKGLGQGATRVRVWAEL